MSGVRNLLGGGLDDEILTHVGCIADRYERLPDGVSEKVDED